MHSQSSNIQKAEGIESETKPAVVNNTTSKSMNNQNGAMIKRKSTHLTRKFVDSKHNPPTIDLPVPVVNRYHQVAIQNITALSPTKFNSKSQQVTNGHCMAMPSISIVPPNNGRTDITDDNTKNQNFVSINGHVPHYPGQLISQTYTPTSTNQINISSSHLGNQQQNFHNNNQSYQHQQYLQMQQNVGNRQNIANRQNNHHVNKKSCNSHYTKYKKAGNSSNVTDKSYNSINEDNNNNYINNNKNVSNYKSTIKPAREQLPQQPIRNYKLNNGDKTKSTSPVRDSYSSSSSSSSLSSVPLKKSNQRHHSPFNRQLMSSINFQEDYRPSHKGLTYVDECQSLSFSPYEGYIQGGRCYDTQSSTHIIGSTFMSSPRCLGTQNGQFSEAKQR